MSTFSVLGGGGRTPRKAAIGEMRGPDAAPRGERAPREMPNLSRLKAYIEGNFLPVPEDATPVLRTIYPNQTHLLRPSTTLPSQ